jgi:hypothetical protein
MAMGYWLDAEQHLTEALESPDHPWVAKNRAGLEGALANLRSKIGEITIGGAVPGAAVQVNGRMAGTIPLPAPIRLAKGKVEIRVSAVGYATSSQVIRVAGGDTQRVTVALELDRSIREREHLKDKPPPGITQNVAASGALTGSLSGAPPVDVAVAQTMPPPGQGPLAASPADENDSSRTLRKVAWVAAGLGVGSLVFGVVEIVTQSSRVDRFNNHLGPTVGDPTGLSKNCGGGESGHGGPGCADLYSDISTGRTLEIIGLAGGGALLAGSVILFLASTPRQATGTSIGTTCGPNLQSPGLQCRMSF